MACKKTMDAMLAQEAISYISLDIVQKILKH